MTLVAMTFTGAFSVFSRAQADALRAGANSARRGCCLCFPPRKRRARFYGNRS